MIATGMRIGEMLTLEWKDINYEKNSIHICKTLQTGFLGDDKTAIKDGTKTQEERYVPMNDNIKEYLELFRKFDRFHGIKSQWVACTRAATMNSPKNIGRSLSQLCEKAGIMVTYNKYIHVIREQEAETMELITVIYVLNCIFRKQFS